MLIHSTETINKTEQKLRQKLINVSYIITSSSKIIMCPYLWARMKYIKNSCAFVLI